MDDLFDGHLSYSDAEDFYNAHGEFKYRSGTFYVRGRSKFDKFTCQIFFVKDRIMFTSNGEFFDMPYSSVYIVSKYSTVYGHFKSSMVKSKSKAHF